MKSLQHIAIIMDGNNRWAKAQNLETFDGHKAGTKNAFNIIEACIKQGISNLSLFAFSSENWNRPQKEVENFLSLLSHHIEKDENKLHSNGIKIKFVGDLARLTPSLRNSLEKLEEASKHYTKLNLYIMLIYGSRAEIVYAAKNIIKNNVAANDISEENFANYMYVPDMPDVDLLIRAGNQYRISNFLLWHAAYAELYFSKKLWPDFSENDLEEAIAEYYRRIRTFGTRITPIMD